MAVAQNPSYVAEIPAEGDADIVLTNAPLEVQEAAEHARRESARVRAAREAAEAERNGARREFDDEVIRFGNIKREHDRVNKAIPDEETNRHTTKLRALKNRQREHEKPIVGLSNWFECESFLRRFKNGNAIVAAPSVVLSNKSLLEQLKSSVSERSIITDRLATTIRTKRPKADAAAHIKSWVATKSAGGQPRLGRTFRPIDLDSNGDFSVAAIGDPELPQTLDKVFEGGGMTTRDDPLAFLFWLNADQIESRLLALLDMVDFAGAMTGDEKATAVAAGQAKLIACIRRQHAIHTALEQSGTSIREGFWHPAIVLQIEYPPKKILADMPQIELRPRKK